MADLTNMFQNAFAQFDQQVGANQVNKSQAQILDPNMIGNMANQPVNQPTKVIPEDDTYAKAYEKSKYPEEAGMANLKKKQEKEAYYKSILNSITQEEFDSLNYLVKNGGYVCIDKSILKSIGENGESLHTKRLENWGLVTRDKIPGDDLIQFTIKSIGKSIVNDIKKITGAQ